jgi:predicted DNA-binding transcriptional regulator AlpA
MLPNLPVVTPLEPASAVVVAPARAAALYDYFESWKIAQVLKVYGKSRSSLLAEVKAGTFPPPFQNGDTNLWHSGEVLAEMRRRIDQSRANPRKKVVGKQKAWPAEASGVQEQTPPIATIKSKKRKRAAQAQPATVPMKPQRRPSKSGTKRKPK